jgi:putative membrane protein insertion efficiency factor
MRNLLHHIVCTPRNLIVSLIGLYQKTLSPDHGPMSPFFPYGYCRHSPTCSQYSKEVILSRGALIGGLLAAKRVLSCNPFTKPSDKRILEVASRL